MGNFLAGKRHANKRLEKEANPVLDELLPHPDVPDDSYGTCEYCGCSSKLLLDDAGRYACVWCLETRD